MRTLYLSLLLGVAVLFGNERGNAQEGWILILHGTTYAKVPPRHLDTLARAIVKNVDTASIPPADLSRYSVVLLQRGAILNEDERARILNFAKEGRGLYDEDLRNSADTILQGLGIQHGLDAMVRRWDSVYGVPGSFLSGFRVSKPSPDPMAEDVPDGLHMNGPIQPVLKVDGSLNSESIAWISSDTSLHIVFAYEPSPFFYDQFMTEVLCDYLQACKAAVREEKREAPDVTILEHEGYLEIVDRSQSMHTEVHLYDALARKLLTTTIESTVKIPLDRRLPRLLFAEIVQGARRSVLKVFLR
jgi:hypothetical protein